MALTNSPPYEVMAGPWRAYLAPVGTAFPAVGALESTFLGLGFVKIGTSGDLNYDRPTGVTVQHRKEIVKWRSSGDGGSRKAFLTEEDMMIKFKVADFSLEHYKVALNGNDITVTPGQKKIGLSHGFAIRAYALLLRSELSPYGDQMNSQYEVPRCIEDGSPEVALAKPGEPAAYDLQFSALVDSAAANDSERFGRLVIEDDSVT